MKILKRENDFDSVFGEKRKETDKMKKSKDIDKEIDQQEIEDNGDEHNIEDNENYIDPEDLNYYEYEDIVSSIEENGWSLKSSAGSYPITHFDTDIIHTKPGIRNEYGDILEISCPPGMLIAICGFNQEDIDKEEFFNSPNLFTRPHFFTIRFTDEDNVEIPHTTIIGISKISKEGNVEKLYQEFYGDLCSTINGKLKKKEDRYYFAETIVIQTGEKLLLQAYWPHTNIMKTELLMMADLFVRDLKENQ